MFSPSHTRVIGSLPESVLFLIALFLGVLLPVDPAFGHSFKRSFADAKIDTHQVNLLFDLDPDDLDDTLRARFDDDHSGLVEIGELTAHQERLVSMMRAGVVVSRDGVRCEGTVVQHRISEVAMMVRGHFLYTCTTQGPVRLEFPLLQRTQPGHLHLLTVREGGEVRTAPLTAENPAYGHEGAARELWRYTVLGVEHILIGIDHLLFLLVLLLGVTSLRQATWAITGFTLGHSLTLGGAALGFVSWPERWVESAIALSITAVAVLNITRRGHGGHRWGVAMALGTLHGFGFAGVLAETNLHRAMTVPRLLAFNLGVEVGQLAVAFPILLGLMRLRTQNRNLTTPELAALGLGALACAVSLGVLDPWNGVGALLFLCWAILGTQRLGYHRACALGLSVASGAVGVLWFVGRAFGAA